MVKLGEFTESQLDAADPDIGRLAEGLLNSRPLADRRLIGAEADLELLGLLEVDTQISLHGMGVSPAANTKHLGALHAAIINDGNISRTATDIHKHGAKILVGVVTNNCPGNGKRLGSYG